MLQRILIVWAIGIISVKSLPKNGIESQDIIVHEDIDELLDLLTSAKTTVDNNVQVLWTFISDILDTALKTKTDGIKKLNNSVFQLIRTVEQVIADAANEDVDISDCVGNNMFDIKTATIDLEEMITDHIEQQADEGLKQLGIIISDLYKGLMTVGNYLVIAGQCKLKDDIEQVACTAQLSVQQTRLEPLKKTINDIISYSSPYYAAIITNIETHTDAYLNEFYKSNLEKVHGVIGCANTKLPTPFLFTTDWPNSSSARPSTTDWPNYSSARPSTTDWPNTSSARPSTTDWPNTSSARPSTTDWPNSSSARPSRTDWPNSSSARPSTTDWPSSSSARPSTTDWPNTSSARTSTTDCPNSSSAQPSKTDWPNSLSERPSPTDRPNSPSARPSTTVWLYI